jgi:predicted nucleotidyltransferase
MTPLESAAAEITAVLNRLKLPYMLIGGMALAAWGEPRATLDVDITLWPAGSLHDTVRNICHEVRSRAADPEAFAERTRVLPLVSRAGPRIDVLFAAFPFEKQMIDRAHTRTIDKTAVRVATVEDLIVLKAVSKRVRDADDVARLVKRFRSSLDANYLQHQLAQLASALDRPDLLDLTEQL